VADRPRGTLPVTVFLAAVIVVAVGQVRAGGWGWLVDWGAMAVVMSRLPRGVAVALAWRAFSDSDKPR